MIQKRSSQHTAKQRGESLGPGRPEGLDQTTRKRSWLYETRNGEYVTHFVPLDAVSGCIKWSQWSSIKNGPGKTESWNVEYVQRLETRAAMIYGSASLSWQV